MGRLYVTVLCYAGCCGLSLQIGRRLVGYASCSCDPWDYSRHMAVVGVLRFSLDQSDSLRTVRNSVRKAKASRDRPKCRRISQLQVHGWLTCMSIIVYSRRTARKILLSLFSVRKKPESTVRPRRMNNELQLRTIYPASIHIGRVRRMLLNIAFSGE
ncbi:hypothetical protein F4805DRAFT_144221 [Annulohypoxylon moriforme]|nr:hypothetical protein F4805DRAFT_144221 [Annulohypoxylon moriforme]